MRCLLLILTASERTLHVIKSLENCQGVYKRSRSVYRRVTWGYTGECPISRW